MARNSFFIIDGHSQIHRAFHARMPPLTSSTGEPTKATFVFCKTLFRLLREKQPRWICMATDSPRPKLFRTKLHPGYKGDRGAPNEELTVQIKRIKQIVKALGIPVLQMDGYEADDIIATVADCLKGLDLDVVIVSKDKDLHQLLSPNISMYDPASGDYFTYENIPDKWGVPADKTLDMQVLMGDSGDCVPGVRGIGPKTAANLINTHGSIRAILKWAQAQQKPPKVAAALLQAQRDGTLKLSRKLVTLDRNVPIDFDVDDMEFKGINPRKASPIFRELGFTRWAKWGDE